MNEEDKKLLEMYMLGFNDELDRRMSKSKYESYLTEATRLLIIAYNIGKSDAIVGDDVRSSDYQTNEEIIKRIRNTKQNE